MSSSVKCVVVDEVDAAFLDRVQSAQKDLKNVDEGKAIAAVSLPRGSNSFDKNPVEDDEVDFFKEFALEDLEEVSHHHHDNEHPLSKSITKTSSSGGFSSLNLEMEISGPTEVISKTKEITQGTMHMQEVEKETEGETEEKEKTGSPTEELVHKGTKDEDENQDDCVEVQGSRDMYSLHQQGGLLETVEEEVEEEETNKDQSEVPVDNTSAQEVSHKKLQSPTKDFEQLQETSDKKRHPSLLQMPTVQPTSPARIEAIRNPSLKVQIEIQKKDDSKDTKKKGSGKKDVSAPRLKLQDPKECQEKESKKRKHPKAKTSNLFFNKLASQPAKHQEARKESISASRDKSNSPVCKKKQKKSDNVEKTPSPKIVKERSPTHQDFTVCSASPGKSKGTNGGLERQPSQEDQPEDAVMVDKQEISSENQDTCLHAEEGGDLGILDLDMEGPDLENMTKELEFMVLDAKLVENQLLEMKLRLAIQANKLMRLDNPMIRQKLQNLKKQADQLLKNE